MFRELEKNLIANPGFECLYYNGVTIKNSELLGLVDAFSQRLIGLGVRAGDVITIALPNIPQSVIAIYGVNKIGGICNIIDSKLCGAEIVQMAKVCKSEMVILQDEKYLAEKEVFDCGNLQYIFADIASFMPKMKRVAHRMKNGGKKDKLNGALFFGKELSIEAENCEVYEFEKNQVAIYLHRKIKGEDKVLKVSNENINVAKRGGGEIFEGVSGGRILSAMKFSSGFGLCYSLHLPLLFGMTCVLGNGFESGKTVALLKKSKANFLCGTPKMFEALLKFEGFISKDIIGNLKMAYCFGRERMEGLQEKFNAIMQIGGSNCRLLQGYGNSETVCAVTACTPLKYKEKSFGKPLAGVRVKILNGEGVEVAKGEKGEIVISSLAVANGYLGGKCDVRGGYLHTGDFGYVDSEGYLFCEK